MVQAFEVHADVCLGPFSAKHHYSQDSWNRYLMTREGEEEGGGNATAQSERFAVNHEFEELVRGKVQLT